MCGDMRLDFMCDEERYDRGGSSSMVLFCSGHRAATFFSVCFEVLYYQKLSCTLLYLTYLAVTKVANSVEYKHHRINGTVQNPYGLLLL